MLYAIIGMLVIIADQYIKFWVQGHIALTSTGEEFIPGILSLVNVHNDGAAFGFLAGSGARIPFIIVAGVFTVAVIIALATKLISGKLARWSIVLVTAGALSNCLDRVLYGYVQDMFKTEFMNFPVFNLADVFITVFAIVFALAVIFGKTRRDDDDDYEFEDEEDDEDEEEYEKPARARKSLKSRRAKRAAAEEDEEDYEEPAPAPARKQPAKAQKTAAPKARASAAKAVQSDDDPFAGWDRAEAKAEAPARKTAAAAAPAARPAARSTAPAQSAQARPAQRSAQPAAKPAAKPAARPAAQSTPKPAAAPVAKPAAKPAPKPAARRAAAAEEEFSLDDILNEFR